MLFFTKFSLYLDDPTCASCSALANAMKDALIKYGDSLTNEKDKT